MKYFNEFLSQYLIIILGVIITLSVLLKLAERIFRINANNTLFQIINASLTLVSAVIIILYWEEDYMRIYVFQEYHDKLIQYFILYGFSLAITIPFGLIRVLTGIILNQDEVVNPRYRIIDSFVFSLILPSIILPCFLIKRSYSDEDLFLDYFEAGRFTFIIVAVILAIVTTAFWFWITRNVKRWLFKNYSDLLHVNKLLSQAEKLLKAKTRKGKLIIPTKEQKPHSLNLISESIDILPTLKAFKMRGEYYEKEGRKNSNPWENYVDKDNYTRAISNYNKVLELDPNNEKCLRDLTKIKLKIGDWWGVINDCNSILNKINKRRIRKISEFLFVTRGEAKLEIGDYQGALDDFKNYYQVGLARNARPYNYLEKYSYYARAFEGLGEYQTAIDSHLDYIKWADHPKSHSSYSRQVFIDIARNYEKLEEHEMVKKYNEKARNYSS